MFPYIISDKYVQYAIRLNVIKKLRESKILECLPLKNSLTDLIDKAVIWSSGWFMYGSTKPNAETYNFKYIVDGNCNRIDINIDEIYEKEDDGDEPVSLSKFFSIRNYNASDATDIREDKLDIINKQKKTSIKRLKKNKGAVISSDEFEQIKKIVNIFNKERADNYNSWMEVGWALHNIGNGGENFLDLWIEFSKKSDKYKEGCCEKHWAKMKKEGLGLGSIHYFAKQDNYDKYRGIIRTGLTNLIDTSIESALDYDLAAVLHEMYKYQFVCSSGKKTGNGFNLRITDGYRWKQIVNYLS